MLALAATPNYVFKQRGPYAKEGMDFSQVADLDHRPRRAWRLPAPRQHRDGGCRARSGRSPRPGLRPTRSSSTLAEAARAAERNRLWDAHIAIWAVADQVQRCTVLWTVSDRDPTLSAHDAGLGLDPGPRMRKAPAYQVPERLGFHIVERWQFNFAQVTRSTR